MQADSGAGLDKGIIGLVNKGQPRKLDDWGVVRAWAWTDSRILDYLQTDPDVDGAKVGIMGHSRYGKAAVVTEADDPRFAIGYISSSGKGGVVPFRRNYGETLANSVSAGAFDWFAGNLMRYAAVGHTANDLPMDSNEFLALIAPRPVFIGGGVLLTDPQYAPGDAWQDITGSFLAAVAASPAWNLLGAKGLGISSNAAREHAGRYRRRRLPPAHIWAHACAELAVLYRIREQRVLKRLPGAEIIRRSSERCQRNVARSTA